MKNQIKIHKVYGLQKFLMNISCKHSFTGWQLGFVNFPVDLDTVRLNLLISKVFLNYTHSPLYFTLLEWNYV